MCGNNKIKSSKIETLVGQSIEITGDVKFDGGLHLDGKIIGNVTSEEGSNSVLVISDLGRIEGDVSVAYAVINGEVNGNVYASMKLELSPKARINGNVHYNLLEMASGSEVNGKMVHDIKDKKLLEHHKDTSKQQTAKPDEQSSSAIHNMDQAAIAKS